MILDRELRYVRANDAYCAVTMSTREQLYGRNIFELFPNDDDGGRRLRASFLRVLETGEPDTLAYIPYDIPKPDGGFEQRFWTAVHSPIRDGDGFVTHILQNTVDVTEIARLQSAASLPFRAMPGAVDLLQRAKEAEAATQKLLAEGEDFRRLFQQAPSFIAVMRGPEHQFVFVNDAYAQLIGGRNVIGMDVRTALPEIRDQGFAELLDDVYRTGTPHSAEGARVLLADSVGEELREHFVDFSYAPIYDEQGEITGVFVQGADRTESFRAQQRQRVLLDELNHRVKNTLATVQSIASQTLRADVPPKDALAAFQARLKALSATHNLLSLSNWNGADLLAIVSQELAPFGADRARMVGRSVELMPRVALSLAMVLHELATNAAKHGSLSAETGAVEVAWDIRSSDIGDGGKALTIRWRETGGPAPSPATDMRGGGFGSRLVRYGIEGELRGKADMRFPQSGLDATFSIPLPEGSQIDERD